MKPIAIYRKNQTFAGFLLASFLLTAQPTPVWAGVCEDLHAKLCQGHPVQAQEADLLSEELSRDSHNPLKHVIAGEVLISLGLYDQAEAQFDEATRLQKGIVPGQFAEDLKEKHHTLRFLAPYMQKNYPNDPAFLFYLANRDLAAVQIKQWAQKASLMPIINEFMQAADASPPWPGAASMLAMLEYTEATHPAIQSAGSINNNPSSTTLINLSIKHANQALKQNPNDPLAKKILLIATVKSGRPSENLESALQQLLQSAPLDPAMNLLLARLYMAKGDYKSAIRPMLICQLAESHKQAEDLVRHVDPADITATANQLIAQLGANSDISSLLRINVADLLVKTGRNHQALQMLCNGMESCPPNIRTVLALRIGQVLGRMHNYSESVKFLDAAWKFTDDTSLQRRIVELRNRNALLNANFKRDLATHVKVWIDSHSRG